MTPTERMVGEILPSCLPSRDAVLALAAEVDCQHDGDGCGRNGFLERFSHAFLATGYLCTEVTTMTDAVAVDASRRDRDDRGRYLRGHAMPGPGRPPRSLDLRQIAEERAEAGDFDLREELWIVLRRLFAQAQAGDVQSARLLFDRLAVKPDDDLAAEGVPKMTIDERKARIVEIVAEAARRSCESSG